MERLGLKIKEIREQRGLTQGQLAAKAKIPRSYLSVLEIGRVKKPSAERLVRIAHALNVPPETLYAAAKYIAEAPAEYLLPTDVFISKKYRLSGQVAKELTKHLEFLIATVGKWPELPERPPKEATR